MKQGTKSCALPLWARVLLTMLLMAAGPWSATADEIPYASNLPPGARPVEVKAGFVLTDINAIDEQHETFEIKGILYLQWHDQRQAFDSVAAGVGEKLYQGTYQYLEAYNGWWPQLVLDNAVGMPQLQGVALRVAPDGTMRFWQEVSAVVKSRMNLRQYPFDQQELQAIFAPLVFHTNEVKLVTGPDMVDVPDHSVRVSGWELLNVRVNVRTDVDRKTAREYSEFILTLEMNRLPASTIWFIMVPMTMIVMLSTVVFWMDRESLGNRMDISFIGLLTIVAYQALAVQGLPQISYFILIDGFIYTAYLTMAVTIVSNIVVDRLNRRGASATADRFDQIARWAFPAGFFVLNLISALYFYYL